MLSETVRADARQGDIKCNSARSPRPSLRSRSGEPFFDPQHGPNTNVVLRARDAHKLAQAKPAVEEVLERAPWAQ